MGGIGKRYHIQRVATPITCKSNVVLDPASSRGEGGLMAENESGGAAQSSALASRTTSAPSAPPARVTTSDTIVGRE